MKSVPFLALGAVLTAAALFAACGKATQGTCEETNDCASVTDATTPLPPELDGSQGQDASADVPLPQGDDDGGPPGDSGNAGDANTINLGDGGCNSGYKPCDKSCVAIDNPAYGCTPTSCTACAIQNATNECSAGACHVGTCNSGFADCAGAGLGCTNLDTTSHCGNCNVTCGTSAPVCLEGDAGTPACTLACPTTPSTEANCSGSCVDLATNNQNCGACGNPCPSPANATATCSSKVCGLACNTGYQLCSGACVDLATNNQNCGACGTTCTNPSNGTSTCTNKACVVACASGFHVCQSACYKNSDLPNAPADPCEISETFGVFVSATQGADGAGSGSRSTPYKTIGAGLAAAATAGKRLYVCADTYPESITLKDGVDMFGYFSCASGTWAVGGASSLATVAPLTSPVVTATNLTKGVYVEGFAFTSPNATAPGASSVVVFASSAAGLTLVNDTLTAGKGATGAGGTTGAIGSGQVSCSVAGDSHDGGPGTPGTAGAVGTYSSSGFLPGAAAAQGGPGHAGDCGGAGLSGVNGTCGTGCSAVCCTNMTCDNGPPSFAGKPGTGGNPGGGGTGASGGGASIGIFSVASAVTVTGGKVITASGGTGGSGGPGGGGVAGAQGATGIAGQCGATGGAGGPAGGAGGAGGPGGGGAGGDSYCAYTFSGQAVVLGGTTTTTPGTAGAGGMEAGGITGTAGKAAVHN